jgi:hypothetical protein
MIPKIIHYCWFGNSEIPLDLQKYILGWNTICSGWEIKLWNESNFDVFAHLFTKTAYEQKKYAYVSDYVRAWVLYNYGGVYLDVDVELKLPLDEFLNLESFSCFETDNFCFSSAIWGSIAKHSLLRKVLSYYEGRAYSSSENTNVHLISSILYNDFKIVKFCDENQLGYDGENRINIFSSNYFCLDIPVNYATHHFYGSWLDENNKKSYKNYVNNRSHINKIKKMEYDRELTVYIAKKISFKELARLFFLFAKNRIKNL